MHVVMVSAEATPYAKVGGLADVVGALPKAMAKLGARPAIVIPAYRSLDRTRFRVKPCPEVPGFEIRMGVSTERADVLRADADGSGVEVFLIGSQKYFDRDGIYDDPVTRDGYPDNDERFIFFMKGALDLWNAMSVMCW